MSERYKDHQDSNFQTKKTAYFQSFMIRHLAQARLYRAHGLLGEGSREWRNVARHQLLSAVMIETISELIVLPADKAERLVNLSLIHDVDKREQLERLSKEQVIKSEFDKKGRPLVAVSSNFTGFSEWGLAEFILRYVDSSVGENPNQKDTGDWYHKRDIDQLPEVMILPWRQRIQMFKENKVEEGERGVPLYGMTTWERLEQMMEIIEDNLFNKITKRNPDLVIRYNSSAQLTELIEGRIHEKILDQLIYQ